MHELSVASSMLERIGREVPKPGSVTRVHVTIGPLSGICADSLAFGFDILAKEQGYTRARLDIERTRAAAVCAGCTREYKMDLDVFCCPFCGSVERDISSGSQFTLDYVETEEE